MKFELPTKLKTKIRKVALLFSLVVVISAGIYLFYYEFHAKQEIEQTLNKTCKSIQLESSNDTEIVQKIIKWECEEYIKNSKPFTNVFDPRRCSKDAKWYIFLNRGSCGERAVVFEDMAERSNLTYRKIHTDKLVRRNGKSNNHRWSEVWLDGDWRIADAGFGFYYPLEKQLSFTNRGYLIGHVVTLDENNTLKDLTEHYVNETIHLVIKVTEKGNPVENASISINMLYNNKSYPVIGRGIKYFTNSSGVCEVNLGAYDDVNYTITVSESRLFHWNKGDAEIKAENKTYYLNIELNKWVMNTVNIICVSLLLLEIAFLIYIKNRKLT